MAEPDKPPRNLKAMLSEAKDTSELMVDLAYAALFFSDERMADEVGELEERLSDLVHEMREISVLAARSPREAEQMSSVLHLISAIERLANAAVDITRVVTHRLGIPADLVADLAAAEEISHRVRIRPDSALAQRRLADVEVPVEVGMRVMAIRRGKDWLRFDEAVTRRVSLIRSRLGAEPAVLRATAGLDVHDRAQVNLISLEMFANAIGPAQQIVNIRGVGELE